VHLESVIRDALGISLRSTQQSIQIDIDDSVRTAPAVLGQRVVLLQVLSNLLVNAAASLEKVQQADKRISLSVARATGEGGDRIDLQCRDSGSGIEATELADIFKRGFGNKRHGKGSGLGLHWCANALGAMGGRIYAESEGPGRGACFHVELSVWLDS
jgi:C4-dicarboxylate-specific signal transduction histidine kinase